MRRALREHRRDFVAIVGLVALAGAIAAYILLHQPAFSFNQSYYTVRAPFSNASAVTSGQGQAVTIAGVQVGQVGEVKLVNGQAVVTMNIFRRYAPIYRDATVLLRPRTPLKDMYLALDPGTKQFATLLAARNANLRTAIHNLQRVATSLGGVDGQLASLIVASNQNFSAISSQDANLEAGLALFPGALHQTNTTLGKVQAFSAQLGPALGKLVTFAHALGPALKASGPLFHDTTPVIKNQLRPFSTAVQPVAKALRPAATQLSKATPPLTRSIGVLNTLFNTLAYQPKGSEQGYLFWGSWLAHIASSLTSVQDAHGASVRGIFMATCSQLNLLETTIRAGSPSIGPLLDLLNA